MTATVRRPEVTAFVAAVRRELDDLSSDEIDELTGGLEADLDDAIADGPDPSADPAAMFGVPAAYAAELRAAAGLPPRAVAGGRRGAASSLGDLRRRGSAWLTSRGWWPGVRDFAVTLRPAWWVVRAGVATLLLALVVGAPVWSVVTWIVFAVLTVVSVEIGRRNLAGRGAMWTVLIAIGNVVAALLLLPVLSAMTTYEYQAQNTYPMEVPPENGLWLNGVEVRNVLPYDSEGRPLRDVQLFDENGRPLAVGDSARMPLWNDGIADSGGTAQVPAVTGQGTQAWNVFPLRQIEVQPGPDFDVNGNPVPKPVGTPEYPGGGSLQVPQLITPAPSAAPSPSASPTPSAAPPAVPSSGTPTAAPSSAATN